MDVQRSTRPRQTQYSRMEKWKNDFRRSYLSTRIIILNKAF